MTFYNTTNLTGDELDESRLRASSQKAVILELFARKLELSPSQVAQEAYSIGLDWPITSVRRAITNLTSAGKLHRTHLRVTGPHGAKESLWRIAS